MAAPECPVCHKRILLAGGQPYCAQCGWNHSVAVTQLRRTLKTFPVSGLFFLGFGYFVIFRHLRHVNPNAALLLLAFPAAIMVLSYFLMLRKLHQLESLPNPVATPRAKSEGESSPNAGIFEPSAQDQALLRTSRPREIRMSAAGKFGIVAAVIFAWGLAGAFLFHLYTVWARHQSFAGFRGGDWAVGVIGMLLLLVPYGVWRGQQNECDLLENGEVVLGKVTRQWGDNRGSSSIECDFADYQGQSHSLIASDNSKCLGIGMSVPVFYDRDNPRRAIAACATLHKVVT